MTALWNRMNKPLNVVITKSAFHTIYGHTRDERYACAHIKIVAYLASNLTDLKVRHLVEIVASRQFI